MRPIKMEFTADELRTISVALVAAKGASGALIEALEDRERPGFEPLAEVHRKRIRAMDALGDRIAAQVAFAD